MLLLLARRLVLMSMKKPDLELPEAALLLIMIRAPMALVMIQPPLGPCLIGPEIIT
jgi:hypothetical protein